MLTNTFQKNNIDQGSETNISSSVVKRKAINLCVQHANQSEKSCLQPKYLSQRQTPGGYTGLLMTGMIEWGQKSKPKKTSLDQKIVTY